ncbi:hypothetical protein UlMin_001527 [Ulmus minor]
MDGENGGDDLFGFIIPLCQVSSSQEKRLRRCPFGPEHLEADTDESSESAGEIPVASVGIVMVSPPESAEVDHNSTSGDVFHTPPEEAALPSSGEMQPMMTVRDREDEEAVVGSGGTVAVSSGCTATGGTQTVDLSRDSDLGFSEVELTQRAGAGLGANVSQDRVLRRGLSSEEGLDEPPWKKSKISEQNSEELIVDLESQRATPFNQRTELNSEKGVEESPLKKSSISDQNSEELAVDLESQRATPFNQRAELQETVGINENPARSSGERSAMINQLETEAEANGGNSDLGNGDKDLEEGPSNRTIRKANEQGSDKEKITAREFMESIAVLHNASSGKTQETVEQKTAKEHDEQPQRRVLPNSILGQSKNLAGGDDHREVTLLDVLKLLKEDSDDCIPSGSLLEICKRRGMTFPRPKWWPENGANWGDEGFETGNFGRNGRSASGLT